MLRMALESNVWGPHSLHTAEATGSKPVTPTSTNASPPRSGGPFARRFARRLGLRVVAAGQRGLSGAAGNPTRLLCVVKPGSRHGGLAATLAVAGESSVYGRQARAG